MLATATTTTFTLESPTYSDAVVTVSLQISNRGHRRRVACRMQMQGVGACSVAARNAANTGNGTGSQPHTEG